VIWCQTAAIFGRYANRRLTLRDVLRVRLERAVLMLPIFLLLEPGGALPALRAFVTLRGPEFVAAIDALAARRAPPTASDCTTVMRGADIVFRRSGHR